MSNELAGTSGELRPPMIDSALPDALEAELGQIIAEERKQWRRERELIEAQGQAMSAQLRADITDRLADTDRRVAERLADADRRMAEKLAKIDRLIDERLARLRDGAKGERGDVGPAGEKGATGERGEQGAQGPEGPQGPQGLAGQTGPQGPAGAKGDPGEQGPQGPGGEPGARGDPGPGGAQGPAGESGQQGPVGQAGARGEKGDPGPAGAQGPIGKTGDIGPQGPQGERGEAGAIGKQGEPGQPGKAGDIGPRGEKGDRGEQGPPGKLPIAKLWEPDSVCYLGDVVVFKGTTWQARRDTAKPPGHIPDWVALAWCGQDGKDARTPQICGTWKADGDYHALDIVALNGGSFIARKDAPGPCPGDGWQLIVSEGKRGKSGESITGPRGERGPSGERGPPGEPAPRLVSWRIDRKKYRAIARYSDGTEMPLELRELFEQFVDDRNE